MSENAVDNAASVILGEHSREALRARLFEFTWVEILLDDDCK